MKSAMEAGACVIQARLACLCCIDLFYQVCTVKMKAYTEESSQFIQYDARKFTELEN